MAQSKARKKKRRVGRRATEIAFLVLMIGLILFAAQSWLTQPNPQDMSSSRKAAVIDQLSIAYPNPAFKDELIRMFKDAGFDTDIYTGSQVTLSLYRELPSM